MSAMIGLGLFFLDFLSVFMIPENQWLLGPVFDGGRGCKLTFFLCIPRSPQSKHLSPLKMAIHFSSVKLSSDIPSCEPFAPIKYEWLHLFKERADGSYT
jgi:hypothetical protein